MRRFLVVGDPVAHSRSPVIHAAAHAFYGLEARYEALRVVDEAGLAEVASRIRSGEISGANITLPHKRAAFALSDRVVGPAATARSVNTWLAEEATLVGASTDIPGIVAVWDLRGFGEGPVHVLGAGGAAAAAVVALSGFPLTISARRPQMADQILSETGVRAVVVPWGEPVEAVVVNSTPVGMGGEHLPEAVVAGAIGFFEMAYGESPTPAFMDCANRGLPVADGLDLLVAQAALSFELWFGLPAPLDIMRKAARK